MDLLQTLLLLLSSIVLVCCLYIINPKSKCPPGPKPFPIIGNIHELGPKPHRSLAKLSKTYGPLMSLQLGSMSIIVVSSREMAKLVLQKYDQVFANRANPNAIRALNHHKYSVAWIPADSNWRRLRKISKEHMFSVSRLEASKSLRMEKLQQLCDYVSECCVRGEVVDIGRVAFTTLINLMSASLFSMDVVSNGSDLIQDLKDVVCGIMELIGKPNFSDYFPILKLFDPQGFQSKTTIYFKKCFEIFDKVIKQRLQERMASSDYTQKNDMLEALLDINEKEESELSFDEMNHLLLDLFVAGTDTSSGTVEWAMTELMRDPEKMIKARNELREVVGPHGERVQESDISRLPYLRAVIKETFRLHPTVPLLLPRIVEEDIEVNNFLFTKYTQIMVNAWAIGRDPEVWLNPNVFMPERFLEQDIEFQGQHFELIPFGAGRRICLGMPLGTRMVHLMVATLIHNFNWKLEEGYQPGEIDIGDRFGLSLQKASPLKAIPLN